MAVYRNNFLSRAFEEALMRAKIPYRLVGDVG
jgi:DNA helicase II / ATP-dependent DNA helicase PcrA